MRRRLLYTLVTFDAIGVDDERRGCELLDFILQLTISRYFHHFVTLEQHLRGHDIKSEVYLTSQPEKQKWCIREMYINLNIIQLVEEKQLPVRKKEIFLFYNFYRKSKK